MQIDIMLPYPLLSAPKGIVAGLAFFLKLAVGVADVGLRAADGAALKLVSRTANKPTAISIDADQVKVSALSKPKGGGLALGAAIVSGESGYNRGSLSGESR